MTGYKDEQQWCETLSTKTGIAINGDQLMIVQENVFEQFGFDYLISKPAEADEMLVNQIKKMADEGTWPAPEDAAEIRKTLKWYHY